MPDDTAKAEAKLKKLGERLRAAWAKQHPISERSRETVRSAVREQWEKEQQAQRNKPASEGPPRDRQREPEEPDLNR